MTGGSYRTEGERNVEGGDLEHDAKLTDPFALKQAVSANIYTGNNSSENLPAMPATAACFSLTSTVSNRAECATLEIVSAGTECAVRDSTTSSTT